MNQIQAIYDYLSVTSVSDYKTVLINMVHVLE